MIQDHISASFLVLNDPQNEQRKNKNETARCRAGTGTRGLEIERQMYLKFPWRILFLADNSFMILQTSLTSQEAVCLITQSLG